MKKTKSIFKKAVVTGISLIGFFGVMNASMADVNLEGSFRGREADGSHRKIDLVMRSLSADGRDGAYLAVMLFDDNSEIYTYLIDPTENPHTFVMQPRQVTEDGEVIGTRDPNPTLVMNVSSADGERPRFTIGNAHAGNAVGPQEGMDFTGNDRSDLRWLDLTAGTYSPNGRWSRDNRIDINPSAYQNETGVVMNRPVPDLDGEYTIREKMNGIYALDNISYTATGEITAIQPSKIVLFLEKDSWFGGDYIVLVDPNQQSCGRNAVKIKRI